MVVQAYILVQTNVGKAAEVANAIGAIQGVTLAEDVTGPYDVIVRAEASSVDELGQLVVARVQAVPGITRTVTCPVVHIYLVLAARASRSELTRSSVGGTESVFRRPPALLSARFATLAASRPRLNLSSASQAAVPGPAGSGARPAPGRARRWRPTSAGTSSAG